VDTWGPDIIEGVEQWLTYATAAGSSSMAYFLWLDEGCRQLVVKSEPSIVTYIDALPLKVEKSDVFRVLVLNTIGGIVSV
jgi:mannosyltransferase OCH1-like enzyme